MVRVATYARANLPVPQPTLVLSRQQRRLREHIESQPGWVLIVEFTDHASAMDPNRPGMVELRKQAQAHSFDILLVTSPDRLTRSHVEYPQLMAELRLAGVEVRTPDRPAPSATMLADVIGAAQSFDTPPS